MGLRIVEEKVVYRNIIHAMVFKNEVDYASKPAVEKIRQYTEG